MGRKVPVLDRLAAKHEVSGECWNWTGAVSSGGYGQVWVQGRQIGAHVASYQELVGEIEEGMHVDHLCGNKLCIHPDHLEVVTPGENCRRYHAPTTHCPRGHEYDEANTYFYPRTGKRKCRTCRRKEFQ